MSPFIDGDDPVVDFGLVSLKTVRQAMVSVKLSRRLINACVNRIRRMLKRGVENELVGPGRLDESPERKGLLRLHAQDTA